MVILGGLPFLTIICEVARQYHILLYNYNFIFTVQFLDRNNNKTKRLLGLATYLLYKYERGTNLHL